MECGYLLVVNEAILRLASEELQSLGQIWLAIVLES